MKKLTAMILTACVVFGVFSTVAHADNGPEIAQDTSELVITVNSQEEYNQVVAAINEHNEYVEQLWAQAKRQAVAERSLNSLNNVVPTRAYTVASAHTSFWHDVFKCSITFTATYNVGTNSVGASVITSVYNLDAYCNSTPHTVTIIHKQYDLIDSARTIAANYSLRIGIYDASRGETSYHSSAYYVEFYADGTGQVS